MSTGPRADARRVRPVALLAGLLSGLLGLAGCSLGSPDIPDGDAVSSRRSVVRGVDRLLDQRSRAVLEGDPAAFLATLARDPGLVESQRQWFDDVAALPVEHFDQSVRRRSVSVDGRRATAVVSTSLQLTAYDALPVVRDARLHFVREDGRWRVSAVRDPAWERSRAADLQPWDLGPVEVVEGRGVLGIFDSGSVGRAGELVAVVERAVDDVSAVLPFDWSRRVVLYALTDTRVLTGMDGLPGEDPEALDAVAFPVPGRRGEPGLAGTRFLLHPRMLEVETAELARLVRHEIVHVAVGGRDDGAPLWLSEGIAEWVSVQPLPDAARLVSGAAVAEARRSPRSLPDDDGFNTGSVGAHYGMSWWACQTIADMYGEPALWRLLEAMAGVPADRHDEVLRQVVGMDEARLAEEAAARIVATYG